MRALFVFTIVLAVCVSCDYQEMTSDTFEVTTAGIGIDCHLVLIDFNERDLERIKNITGSEWLRYQAYNLDQTQFGDEGKVLTVRVRKPADEELFPCTAQGPGYPWVT